VYQVPLRVHRPYQRDLRPAPVEVVGVAGRLVVDITVEIVGQEAHRHDLGYVPARFGEQSFLAGGQERSGFRKVSPDEAFEKRDVETDP